MEPLSDHHTKHIAVSQKASLPAASLSIEMIFREVTRELIALTEQVKPAEVAALIPSRRTTSSLAAHLHTLLSDPIRVVMSIRKGHCGKRRPIANVEETRMPRNNPKPTHRSPASSPPPETDPKMCIALAGGPHQWLLQCMYPFGTVIHE